MPESIIKKLKELLSIENTDMLKIIYYIGKNGGYTTMGALERNTGYDESKINYYLKKLDDILKQEDNYISIYHNKEKIVTVSQNK